MNGVPRLFERGWLKYPAPCTASTIECESTDEVSLELSKSPSLSAKFGLGGIALAADAWASNISLSATLSCHSTISASGSHGRLSLGSILGKGAPSAGLMSSKRFTASCKKGTCSPGSSRSWTVCHRTNPVGVRAGIEGGIWGSFSGCRV